MNPFLDDPVAVPQRHSGPWVLRAAAAVTLAWAGSAGAVDLNTATQEQLQGVRGVGPKTAQIIVQERERGGRFLSFSDLSDRVRGIGPKRAQRLQSAGLTVDGGGMRVSGQASRAPQAAPTAPRPSGLVPAVSAAEGAGRTPGPAARARR